MMNRRSLIKGAISSFAVAAISPYIRIESDDDRFARLLKRGGIIKGHKLELTRNIDLSVVDKDTVVTDCHIKIKNGINMTGTLSHSLIFEFCTLEYEAHRM